MGTLVVRVEAERSRRNLRQGIVVLSALFCASCLYRQPATTPAMTPVPCPPPSTTASEVFANRVALDWLPPTQVFGGPYTLVVDEHIVTVIRDNADSVQNARAWRSVDPTTVKNIEVIREPAAQERYPGATGSVVRVTRCLASDWSASISPPKPPGDTTRRFFVQQTDSAGVIRGVVRDSIGKPIGNARVVVREWTNSTVSDSTGRFRLVVPTGIVVLRTLSVGFVARYDSLMLGRGQGADVEIRPKWFGTIADTVWIGDETIEPEVTLNFHWRPDDAIPFAIVTTRDSGRVLERDSIPGAKFSGDSLSRVAFWKSHNRREAPPAPTSIEVRAPGHRPWQRDVPTLPVTLSVVLERDR